MRPLARTLRGPVWLLPLLVAFPVVAGPVLHERFEPDPAEDLRYGATTPSGKMPASMETRSGLVVAPDETLTAPGPEAHAYGGAHTPSSADSSYHLDRLTTRPERVKYDEPFRPSVLPFKRLYAFDRLEPGLSFGVQDETLDPVEVGGTVEHTEDAFFADFAVDVVGGVPVRIPSVGPGARIRALHVDPPQEVQVLQDSAENWFLKGSYNARVRAVMQLSIERQVFGSMFRNVAWASLGPHAPPIPARIAEEARKVAAHIGVSRADSPARAVMTLVDYFRRFRESSELPTSNSLADLYVELSLEQKGVCRHRAYAFAVTALALGIPTRVVHNEAHAWVEVYDSELWHRIDLGGAATDVQESRPDPFAPTHKPPNDPYSWPEGATSARELTPSRPISPSRATDAAAQRPDDDGTPDSEARDDDPGSSADASHESERNSGRDASGSWPGALPSLSTSTSALGPAAPKEPTVILRLGEKELLRGRPLKVQGSAEKDGRPCRLSRVDIYVNAPDAPRAIGSVATGRDGKFEGHVTLPPTTPVGTLELSAKVAGGCD